MQGGDQLLEGHHVLRDGAVGVEQADLHPTDQLTDRGGLQARDECCRPDPAGVAGDQFLGDVATHRVGDDDGVVEAEGVEQRGRVVGEVGGAVRAGGADDGATPRALCAMVEKPAAVSAPIIPVYSTPQRVARGRR